MKSYRMLLISIIHAIIFLGSGTFGQSTSLFKDKNGTLHVFSENVDLPFAINNVGVLEAMSALAKCMQRPCPPHHYRSGCEELMSKGNCVPCPPCPDHQYRSGCMLMSAGICLNVMNCNPGEFEVQPPTSTTDRQCDALNSTAKTVIANTSLSTSTFTTSLASTSITTLSSTSTSSASTFSSFFTSTTATMPCSNTTDSVLNCTDPSSRAAITSNHICEVRRVDNCCCDEFSSLIRVSGDINVRSNETMLHFGTIREVKGKINGNGESENNRGSLKVVDFGQVTRVGGNVQLRMNHITRVEFGALLTVDGWLSFWINDITSIDFGAITRIDGWLSLNNNALTSIDFGAVTHISGSVWLYSNGLTSIDFGIITQISGSLSLYNNDITSIDFGAITHIGGGLSLYNNDITSIDFGPITQISGSLSIYNNDLTSIDFGAITHIGSSLRVHNNPSLNSIDCRNLGSCLCRSSNTNPTNCPNDCTWSACA